MSKHKATYQQQSEQNIYLINKSSRAKWWLWFLLIAIIAGLFLPWTQNIQAKGSVTTLYQNQRPQQINSPISGKIVKWYVKEGDYVKKGDTIVQLSEVKADYLDPKLIERTQAQIDAKKAAIDNYQGKVTTTNSQIEALEAAKNIKLSQNQIKIQQIRNKINSDRAELSAAINDVTVTEDQYRRQQKMYDAGLVSQTQLQQRNVAYQNALAKKTVIENKLAQSQQDLNTAELERMGILQDYSEKINKAAGEKYQSLSQVENTYSDVSKLENQVSNYVIRNDMYYVLAPQDGQVVQANKGGIGEIFKEGESLATIVPTNPTYAVALEIKPMDVPLISKGQTVRLVFDGYPAVVFTGWPEGSYGTFGGKVLAIESVIDQKNMFKVLVVADTTQKKWPGQLKIGTGSKGIALLKDVPVWYELWRTVNGFPPDYYVAETGNSSSSKKSGDGSKK